MCIQSYTYGQEVGKDTLISNTQSVILDSLIVNDSSTAILDTLPEYQRREVFDFDALQDTSRQSTRNQPRPTDSTKISDDKPDEPINYGSADSSYLDLKENQIHLFGKAFVKYGKFNLDAGYIIFDFDDNEASAFDTLPGGLKLKNANFTDGTNTFSSTGLRYNFKSHKGIIYDAVTSEGEFQVLGRKTKFVSADADTMSTADQIYNQNAVITTCTAPIPHYGIRSRKLKVVPNRLAVAGFSQLELSGIPTPVVLPFGFYPLVDGLSSGIIFPADFDSNPELGLGVRGVGYYFPISDYLDMTVTGDFYTRGTHRININSSYRKRYKYNGRVSLKYANNIVENPTDLSRVSNKGFSINITRTQDSKAHPYQSISGSIDISVGDFYATNYNDFESQTKKEYTSNFTYKNILPGTPFSLTVGMSHNQNTRTGNMNITLPNAKLTMTSITPFKSKIPSSTEKWYEKINISGSSEMKAFVNTADSALFTQETLDKIETGMYNRANATASFKLLKYFNVSPSVSVDQYLFARTLDKTFDEELLFDTLSTSYDQDSMLIIEQDTTFGQVEDDYINGLRSFHRLNTGVSINTQIFGTKRWSKGWLRGIRHTMKPSVSFSYTPSTLGSQEPVQFTIDPTVDDQILYYNPYSGGIYNASLSGESKSMSFTLVNNFEGKYYSKKDSTEKKFNFFREIRLSTSYNFAADSIKWQPLLISGNTKLTKYTSLNFNARYDFYEREDGRLVNKTIWDKSKRPFEFTSFNLTLNTGFTLKNIFDLFKRDNKNKASNASSQGKSGNNKLASRSKGFFETIESFRIDHQFRVEIESLETGGDTIKIGTHQLRLSGSLDLTPKWSVRVSNIQYDFNKGDFVYPAFTLSRDLHCWEMNFSWYPESNVYGFFIGVKSSTLSFLKYNYGQQNTNNLGFGPR